MNSALLNGIRTYRFTSQNELIKFVCKEKKILIAVNAEKILHATKLTRSIINKNIGYTDGIGAVWAMKQKGYPNATKIPGCELWLDIIRKLYKDHTFYLIGGKQEVVEGTVRKLQIDFPGIKVLNYRNGYIKTESEKKELIEDIQIKQPDVVFVAMGSPRQELLMQEMQKVHSAVYQGLGGSFDVYIGRVRRAPVWWIKNNLEWAYRLIKQPSRIKRYVYLIQFLFLLLFKKI